MRLRVEEILRQWRPGSFDATGWDWDAEDADLRERICCCCDQPGHYQEQLESYMQERGLPDGEPPLLGDDGRVWDGHHRIVAARRLGWTWLRVNQGKTQ